MVDHSLFLEMMKLENLIHCQLILSADIIPKMILILFSFHISLLFFKCLYQLCKNVYDDNALYCTILAKSHGM